MTERSEVQFGLTHIPFRIRWSDRRERTVALTIETDGKLVVSAPSGVSIDRLNGIVRHKARWIVRRIKRERVVTTEREFVTGETFLYLGRQYRLKIVKPTSKRRAVSLRAGWLWVPAKNAAEAHTAIVGWLRERAESYLPERLAALCRRKRIDVPRMVVVDQRRRWGSCDVHGTLRINWRIVQAPSTLIDYVLAHELVHLEHEGHGRAFWAALGRVMPDYEGRKTQLREVGRFLEW